METGIRFSVDDLILEMIDMRKTLVAYFSVSGVTWRAAEKLAVATGSDLYEIRPAVPYTGADLNWQDKQSRSSLEMRDPAARSALADTGADFSAYDRIFLGFPIWWYTAPRREGRQRTNAQRVSFGGGAVIKSHHNVGGLPKELDFLGVVEPLRGLFKDEVRKLGRMLGLPKELVQRQPFPGPGLAIRVIGEITKEKLDILREADAILREEIAHSGKRADQFFAVLTNTRSVGVMGDDRTYNYVCALRAVRTNDFMTCEYARLPHALLAKISSRITNEVKGINRVVYDITDKPPATIEWE